VDQRVRGPEIDGQIGRNETEHIAEHALSNPRRRASRISPSSGLTRQA
jgi:hypothetical protein